MATYSFNTVSTTPVSSVSEDSENQVELVRVYGDDEIKASIKLDELSIAAFNNYMGKDRASVKNYEGIDYPIIKINSYFVDYADIVDLKIRYVDFIPDIYLSIRVTGNTMLVKNTPKDGDLISIALRPRNDTYKTIRNDFVITNVNTSGAGETGDNLQYISFNGKLFVPNLESDNNCFGYIGTSKEAVKKAAKDLNLGFAFNDEDNTTDTQVWLCCENSIKDYLNNVVKHSWKDETSFYKLWIDAYYNLTLINVNKTLYGPETALDEAVITSSTRMGRVDKSDPSNLEQKNATVGHKIFSNHNSLANTVFHITDWKVVNNSSDITFNYGTSIVSRGFRHNQNLYNSNGEYYESIANEPAYDINKINPDASANAYQILRGRTSFDSSYNFKDIYIAKPWSGIEYIMSDDDASAAESTDSWSGNTHKNYNRAEYHNLINIKELDKLYIIITVHGLCTQFLKGEKVPVILYMSNANMNTNINKSILDDEKAESQNLFYSGYYFIDGIEYEYVTDDKGETADSGYRTNFILKRREWPIVLPGKITESEIGDEQQY